MIGSSASVLVEYDSRGAVAGEPASTTPGGSSCGTTAATWPRTSPTSGGRPASGTPRRSSPSTRSPTAAAASPPGSPPRYVLGYLALGRGELGRRRPVPRGGVRPGRRDGRAAAGLTGAVGTGRDRAAARRPRQRRAGCASAASPCRSGWPTPRTCSRSSSPAPGRCWRAATVPARRRGSTEVEAALRHREIPGTLPAIPHARGLLLPRPATMPQPRACLRRGGRRVAAGGAGSGRARGRSWTPARCARGATGRTEVGRAGRRGPRCRRAARCRAAAGGGGRPWSLRRSGSARPSPGTR